MRSLSQQILQPRCPSCGRGKMFSGVLKVSSRCSDCGLDLTRYNPADGPAFFAITIVGLIITVAACVVEFRYQPALWVHAVLWIPLTFLSCFAVLRAFKSILITLEYRLLNVKETPDAP